MKTLLALSSLALYVGLTPVSYAQTADAKAGEIVDFMKHMMTFPSPIDSNLTLKNIENSGSTIIYTISISDSFLQKNPLTPNVQHRLNSSFLSRTCKNQFSYILFDKGIAVQERYVKEHSSTILTSYSASKETCMPYNNTQKNPSHG